MYKIWTLDRTDDRSFQDLDSTCILHLERGLLPPSVLGTSAPLPDQHRPSCPRRFYRCCGTCGRPCEAQTVIMQASNCDRCYRRKGRCDKQQPCSSCAQANATCAYTDKVRQRRFTSDDVERVEKRLRQSEARNRSLLSEVTRLKAAATTEQPGVSPAGTDRSLTAEARRADAVSEISYLSINAAGERQPYLGSTSGVLFANLVRSSVDASVSRQPTPPAALSEGSADTSISPASIPNHAKRKQELPPEALAAKLMKSYFDHDAIAFPFLSASALLEILERFYHSEIYYSCQATAYETFVFNMTLAIATASVYKYDWQMLPSAESHHARAMQELDQVLVHGGLESLQAILLLCQYRQGSSIKDNSASMWHLVGIAARICLELGLHRESAYPLINRSDADLAELQRYEHQEVSRKCFWCLIAMDRVTSNILGRPLAIRDEDIDALLPSDDDVSFNHPSALTMVGIPRTAVFKSIINYRLLCGKVLTTLHRRRAPSMSTTEALTLRSGLAQELEDWRLHLEELNLPDDSATNISERSCFFSPVWFRVLYANAKLSIWRPCPLLADLSHDQDSLQNIYDSSIQAIIAYSALHKSRKINYSWIALQSIFMAGLSFLYSVSRHFRGKSNHHSTTACCLLREDPRAIDISQTSRACSNVMVAVAERWNALRHCHEVFDRLSDAVLSDALEMQSHDQEEKTQQRHQRAPSSSTTADRISEAMQPPEPALQAQPEPSATSSSINHDSRARDWSGQQLPTNFGAAGSQHSLAVDNEFLHCYDDLQSMYLHQVEDPVMHLSQDWLGYLGGADGLFDQNAEFQGQLGMFE